jgi:hypothetical protein
MEKHIVAVGVLFFVLWTTVSVAAVDTPAMSYSETLPQSAFEKGDPYAAVKMLLKAKVPVQDIINAAIRNGIAQDVIVSALLAAGIAPEKVVLYCLQGPISFKNVLAALQDFGVPPENVLTWLINWKTGLDGLYATCDFMLKNGRSKADLLRTLGEAGADRDLVVQVVRWFDIPPATVIAVYQTFLDYFGHVFNRNALPQPALLAIGVARITVEECADCRPVISPMVP